MALALVLAFCLLLAFANGANDNFKGVATLFGSGTASYRTALIWATATTALGSVAALVMAGKLFTAFSGSGLVPATIASTFSFALSVTLAAAATVLLATYLSFPISTTHSLIGALVGAGLLASPEGINGTALGNNFLLPLITSPFIAVALTILIYPVVRYVRSRLGITHETCVCIGNEVLGVVPGRQSSEQALKAIDLPTLAVDDVASCKIRYQGAVVGMSASDLLDRAHFLTAGLVSFARGLNDTPKIAALLLVGDLLAPTNAILGVAAAIGLGGWLGAKRVGETMSHRITDMTPGQGLTANTITALLVIGASNLGLPVSTTHVACGSLFGMGAVNQHARWKTIREIVFAWVITLPIAGLLATAFVLLFSGLNL